ncbi:MAG TPA: hemerythrin domain-containing protein [Acidimicrobiales bacterium]|nr:hemerythrin domain-containing protein [Acidimicrobiales bacterium]
MADQGTTGFGGGPRPDTSDMVAVHKALRGALGSGAQRVRDVDPSDAARRELIADYYDNILWFLDVHHNGEEELVFPRVRERNPDAAAVVDTMEGQHHEVVQLLKDAGVSRTAWASGDDSAQATLANQLQALSDATNAHLDQEEAQLLPLCADCLTVEEWAEMPGHALRQYQGDKVWLVLGLIMEQRNAEEQAVMLEGMPPPVSQMWRDMGSDAFQKLAATVG